MYIYIHVYIYIRVYMYNTTSRISLLLQDAMLRQSVNNNDILLSVV